MALTVEHTSTNYNFIVVSRKFWGRDATRSIRGNRPGCPGNHERDFKFPLVLSIQHLVSITSTNGHEKICLLL